MFSAVGRCGDQCRTQNEADARAALELRAGHTLTDTEWSAARARLLELMGILRAWDRTTSASSKR
jgi:hypothetical protein